MTSGAPATLADQLRAALADRYRIERELGTGGMATVYLAHDERHDRKVAIKVLKPELAAVLGADRFIVEIKTTAALQHPHILPLFDSGTADGFLYYVMPYIQGETIREKLNRETQFGVVEAVRIAREVADALDYAHRHGVIHRDIKPENLLLHDGRAMVMDFGIALAVSAAAGGRMTETGLSLGTPHYMSPEQATAEKEITGRSDVYSLASVLYEMLTGEPPHMGNSAQQIIMKIITDTPQPVTALRKSVPPNVAAAVANALEKLPADRFESAKAFADALENPAFTTAGTGVLAAGGARGGRRSLVTWALAAASLATLAIGYGVGRRTASAPEARPVQFLVEAPDSVVALNRCCGPAQALSPDGATLVYVGMRSDGGSLYRRSLDRLTSERIPGADEATTPFFSPNGQWVAFSSAGQLKKVSMAGGPALPIAAAELTGGSWGDNDVIIFSRRGSNLLWRVPASGGTPTRVPTSDSLVELSVPFVLPGATHALVNVRSATVPDSWQIGVVDLRSGKIEQIGPGTRAEYANGAIVYTALDNTLLAQPFDLRSRKTTGQAVPIATGVSFSGATLHEFSVSASGLLEYEVGRLESGEQLRVVGGGAGAGTTIPLPGRASANLEDPAISPDGRQIVLRLPAGNIGDLWIMNRQNGTLNRFTVSGGGAAPSWSRDGRFIAYYAPGDSTVKAGIYIRAVDQPDAKLVRAGHNLFPGSWFPDGRSITFATNDPLNKNVALGASLGSFDIGKVTLGDTAVTWLVKTPFSERQPELSPDGRLLAYASNLTSRPEVFVQLLTGGSSPVQVSSEGASSPRWSRDGHTLFYVTPGGSIIAATIAPGAGITVVKRTQVATVLVMDLNTQNVNWDLFPDDKPMVIDQSGGQGRRRMALVQNWPALARALGEGAKR